MYFDIDKDGRFYLMELTKSEYQTIRKALKVYANHQGGFTAVESKEYTKAKSVLSHLPKVE